MNKFKPGDKVIAVKVYPWPLTEGKIYTISSSNKNHTTVMVVNDLGYKEIYYAYRFQLIPKFRVLLPAFL